MKTKATDFNAALLAQHAAMEAAMEGELQVSYRHLLRRAGRDAAAALRKSAETLALTAAPGVTNRSTMVALKPTAAEAEAIAAFGAEPADVLHVTLAYLGETDEPLEQIAAALAEVAATHAPLAGEVGGSGAFPDSGNGHAMIVLPDVPGLVELRVAVTEALHAAGIGYARNHGFTPHVTVDYSRDAELSLDAAGLPLSFGDLYIVRGDVEEILLPLTGTTPVTAAVGEWQPPPEGVLYQALAFSALALQRIGPLHRRVLRLITGETLARVGIAWDITHPLSVQQLAQSGSRTGERLGEAAQPVIRKAVYDAYNDGLSVLDAAKLIRSRVGEATIAQSKMLARTDLNGLANGGSVTAATIAGMPFKRWLSAEDARVRPAHAAADGQVVPIHDPFQVCGEQLAYPGDPAGSDHCTANCRCTVVYLDSDDSAALAAGGGEPMKPKTKAETAAVTITLDDDQAAASDVAVAWVSDLAFEGAATEDGRYILPDALNNRDLPLTLMAMTETGPGGHEGAYVAGRIDTIDRDADLDMTGEPLPDGVTAIRGTGVFDNGGDNGAEISRLVADETLRGVSVDLAINDWLFRDPETGDLIEVEDMTDEQWDKAFFGDLQFAVRDASIMAATVCPTAAFADARIMVASADDRRVLRIFVPFELVTADTLTASAAGLAPVKPPRDWFFKQEPAGATPFTVTPEGQIYGHLALWGTCHTGRRGECKEPPTSPSRYSYFNLGEIECADGSRVPCGQITMGTDHASLQAGWEQAKAHYENTGTCAADVHASDGAYGIWISGAVRPNVTAAQARELMGAKPSGDWRQIRPGGPLEMIGALEVNIPGYPVPRPQLSLVASAEDEDEMEMLALVAAGIPDDDPPVRYHRPVAAAATR